MLKAIYALLGGVFTFKTFMSGLLMTILAIILYNLFVETTQEILNFTLAKINGVNSSGITKSVNFGLCWLGCCTIEAARGSIRDCFGCFIKISVKKNSFYKMVI
jgi:hypothetical protein